MTLAVITEDAPAVVKIEGGAVFETSRGGTLKIPISYIRKGNVKADQFGAQVTPEVYVFDAGWTLRYHGRIDDDRAGSAVASQDLKAAVDAVVAGQEVRLKETKAFGCTIKRVAAQ